MAREILFEIDETTGELRATVKGIPGPGCEAIAEIVNEFAGTPSRAAPTADYTLPVRVRDRARVRGDAGRLSS